MIYIEAFGDRTVVTDHNMNEWFSVGCIEILIVSPFIVMGQD